MNSGARLERETVVGAVAVILTWLAAFSLVIVPTTCFVVAEYKYERSVDRSQIVPMAHRLGLPWAK